MRLFSAIVPPEHVRRDLHATLATARTGPRLRWIPSPNLHLTCLFLGEVEARDLGAAIDSVDAAAAAVAPFEAALQGLGGFPDLVRPRVLFVAMGAGAVSITRLHGAQERSLPVHLRPEPRRRPHAHLTIARPKRPPSPAELEELERELAPWCWRFEVDGIELIESRLESGGARYAVRHATRLRG